MDVAKTALSVMGACAFGLTFVPFPLRAKLDACFRDLWEKLFTTADPFAYIEVSRKSKGIITSNSSRQNPNAYGLIASTGNSFYAEVGLYLGSLNIEFATRRVCVFGMDLAAELDHPSSAASKFVFGLPLNETLTDTFEGAQFSWTHTVASNGKHTSSHGQNDEDADNVFTLRMLKFDKKHLLHPYLNHISTVAHEIRQQNTLQTLYTNGRHGSHWTPVTFKHPSTFSTIALDGDLAERVKADLRVFSESEAYYHSIGRAWKRGYLLYGPPGTGKSSLIAAIANYMHYDIYDLELTNVFNNTGLQTLLMQTTRKSIIVIEDIDCSTSTGISERQRSGISTQRCEELEVYEKNPSNCLQGFTLSGLLNFCDGLLSCYGEERIFIFTTNHKERLDSALLRCGRMDMHIHLSYCTFSAFKKLAINYLGIKNHALYEELEEAMKPGVQITPASIAEILIAEKKSPDEAIKQVLAAVKGGGCSNADGKEQLMAVATKDLTGTLANGIKGRRRKLQCRNFGGSLSEGSARKKRQATVDMYAADPSATKETGLWSSDEETSGDVRAATNDVGEQMETKSNGVCRRSQSKESRESANEVFEKLAGDKPQVIVATNPAEPLDSGKGHLSNAGYEQLAAEAVGTRSDLNVLDSDRGLWRGMTIDDSEESSGEGSRKLATPFVQAMASTNSSHIVGKLRENSGRSFKDWAKELAEDNLQDSQITGKPWDIGNKRYRRKLRARRVSV